MCIRDRSVGGDISPREEYAVDRVKNLIKGRPLVEQAARGLLSGRDQIRLKAPLAQSIGCHAAHRSDPKPGEGTGVKAELFELLAHGSNGVDGGEPDPLVASGDQTLDRAFHLLWRARRLDADRGDDVARRAVGRKSCSHRTCLVPGAWNEDVPAEQRLGLEPRELLT